MSRTSDGFGYHPFSVCSLFFQGHYLATFISLRLVGFLRVITEGADLPAELRDLLYHSVFVFIGFRCIAAPITLYIIVWYSKVYKGIGHIF